MVTEGFSCGAKLFKTVTMILTSMEPKEKIQSDLKQALKEGREIEVSTLRMLLAAITNKEIEKRKKEEGLSDEEIIVVVSAEIKKRREAKVQYEKGERPELAEKESCELEVLLKYMPEQLSEEDVKKLAEEAVQKVGASSPADFGKVMGVLMPQVKGKADGAMVSGIVRELLGRSEEERP